MRLGTIGIKVPKLLPLISSEVLEIVPSGRTIYHKAVEGTINIESEKCMEI